MRRAIAVVGVSALSCAGCSASPRAAPDATPASIVVDAKGTWLDGKRVDARPADEFRRMDGLFHAVEDSRSSAGAAMSEPTPIEVTLPEDASCEAGLNVLMTVMFGGYRRIAVHVGDAKHDVAMAAPKSSGDAGMYGTVLGDHEGPAHVTLTADGTVEIREDRCLAPVDVVKPARLAESLAAMAQPGLTSLGVQCDGGVSFMDVLAAYEAATSVMKSGTLDGGAHGLFWDPPCGPGGYGARFAQPIAIPSNWKARVRVGTVRVAGPLTEAEVNAGIATIHDEIAGCYAALLAVAPTAEGTVSTSIIVSKRGGVVSVGGGGSLPSASGVGCVVSRFANATFANADRASRVTIPIAFSPS